MNNFTKMSVMRKLETEELKLLYVTPLTEIIQVQSEGVMNPESWNDGHGGQFPINEEDPNGDGKGAKGINLWENGTDDNMWDD